LEQFEEEVKLLSSLKHNHIIELIGIKEVDDKVLIVMELMNHGNLL
jgi:serine/threonine protein kinase